MCGRYYFEDLSHIEWDKLLQEISQDLYKQGEIFPTNQVPIITAPDRMEVIAWGFPNFRSPKGTVINARSETVQVKPMFRKAFLETRCVVPTNGFYEWDQNQLTSQGKKQKMLFQADGQTDLFLSGLYRMFDGENRFVILTKEANPSLAPYHHRMPVILEADEITDWLTNTEMAQAKLHDIGPILSATAV